MKIVTTMMMWMMIECGYVGRRSPFPEERHSMNEVIGNVGQNRQLPKLHGTLTYGKRLHEKRFSSSSFLLNDRPPIASTTEEQQMSRAEPWLSRTMIHLSIKLITMQVRQLFQHLDTTIRRIMVFLFRRNKHNNGRMKLRSPSSPTGKATGSIGGSLLRLRSPLFLFLLLGMMYFNLQCFQSEFEFNDAFEPIPNLIQEDDIIYSSTWDAPIVVEKYKLLFFYAPKVACTGFKILFHRMNGINVSAWKFEQVHRPQRNGLRYLFDYSPSQANKMMQDPSWTRAVFVRNPHEKLVSAYLEKGVGTNFSFVRNVCCNELRNCMNGRSRTFPSFVQLIALEGCYNGHWAPQSARIDTKYLPYINFVGNFENLENDGKRLLQRIGAWEEYGKTGWGVNGTSPVFSSEAAGLDRTHATKARQHINDYYNDRDVFDSVTLYYQDDYTNPVFNLDLITPDYWTKDSSKSDDDDDDDENDSGSGSSSGKKPKTIKEKKGVLVFGKVAKQRERLKKKKKKKTEQLVKSKAFNVKTKSLSPPKEAFRFISRDRKVNDGLAKRRIFFSKVWSYLFG